MRSVLFLLLGGLVGCGTAPPPVILGHVAPLTGPERELGEQEKKAILLALEDYAAETADKKNVRAIVVRHADSQGDLATLEGQAVRMIALNRTALLIGGQTATEALRLDRTGVPALTGTGFRPKSLSELTFTTGVPRADAARALAELLRDQVKPARLTLLVDTNDESAIPTERMFAAEWKGETSRIEVAATNDEALEKLAAGLDKNALPLWIGSAATFQRLALSEKLRDRSLAYLGPEVARLPLRSRKAPLYLVTAFAPDAGGERAEAFARRYRDKFGVAPEPQAALVFDNVRLASSAVKAGAFTPARLREELAKIKEFSGLTGTYRIEDNRLVRPAFAGRLEEGKWQGFHRVEKNAAK